MDKVYLHVDLDAFFASVEQLDHPEYRGKPLIVGGLPGDRRSVVSTASYEARRYGVHSAMPTFKAYQLCPQGIFVRGRMNRYQEKSHEVMSVFAHYSPDVVQISVDEAFIDLTGTERLLGDPHDVAVRLKQQVREQTGLTVSVGLAPTMYLAKIASGLHKPDGLTVVEPGTESDFMTALPLEKIWGVGSKTLEHIKSSGFTSTASLYAKSEGLLQSIFGEGTGAFLYHALRGNKGMTFGDEAKNHSISSETTFEFDLTDRYAIDTALLELSQTVMFRLHREGKHAHTVALKIRYEDFTTVSIQETGDRVFSSADDLYERCVRLFTKKYIPGQGIRLLGVAASNVEDNSIPLQNDLFDFTDQKKAKVEKAILAFEDKHPGSKIEKARTLSKKNALILGMSALLSLACIKPTAAATETKTTASGAGSIVFSDTVPFLPDVSSYESPASLFSYTVRDTNIEFLAKGYWQSEIIGTTIATFGTASPFALSMSTPVFSQNVDLTLWFLLNKKWYFESSFADEFTKNTVAAGYYGTGTLKHARIANRGIVFPSVYAPSKTGRSIGGGDNSAPGVMFHFEGDSWQADAVVRYDLLSTKSKLYYGMNTATTTSIKPSAYITGRQFVLPSAETVSAIADVYVESSTGTYKDNKNRTYKKLSSSDYLLIPSLCQIVLSSQAGAGKKDGTLPAIAVTFTSSASVSALKTALGGYGTALAPGDEGTFLGDTQRFFSTAANPPSLSVYSEPLFTQIENTDALYIQYPSSFSPFAYCARYDGGSLSEADMLVVHTSTDAADSSFTAVQTQDPALVLSDFFSEKQLWITVTTSASDDGNTAPLKRFPFAPQDPSFYLNYEAATDYAVQVRSYTPVTRFDIGTDAVSGTVTVYLNDLIDPGASYDSGTGTVTLSRTVSSSDKVYITWNEDSGSTTGGAVASGIGFKYNITPHAAADVALTSRWSFAPSQTFADSNTPSPGFASLSTNVSYENNGLSASSAFSLSIDNTNTTGSYRILGMDDSAGDDVYLSSASGVTLPGGFVPSLNSSGATEFPVLETEFDGSSETVTPVTDSTISGYKVPVSWNYASFTAQNSYAWAGTAIDLGSSGSALSGASTFTIALQSASSTVTGYDVYLQLGVSAENDFTVEDSDAIPTWLISKANSSAENSDAVEYAFVPGLDANTAGSGYGTKQLGSGWQQVTITLSDYDRSRLVQYHDARIIIVAQLTERDSKSFPTEGTVYAGPWSYTGSSFSATHSDRLSLSLSQETDASLSAKKVTSFNASKTNTVQTATWTTDALDEQFTIGRSFEAVSLDSYRYVELYFKYEVQKSISSTTVSTSAYQMQLSLDRPSSSGENVQALTVALTPQDMLPYCTSEASYHLLTVDLQTAAVKIDGTTLASSSATVYYNATVIPVHLTVSVNTSAPDGTIYAKGSFSFDELSLEESTAFFTAQNKTVAAWKKEGVICSAGATPLLQDVSLSLSATALSQTPLSQTATNTRDTRTLTGSTAVSFTAFNVSVSTDAAASYSSIDSTAATLSSAAVNTTGLTTAGYTVSSAHPFFGVLNLSTDFRTSPVSYTRSAQTKATLSLTPVKVPLTLSFATQSTQSLWTQTQKTETQAILTTRPYILSVTGSASQKRIASDDYSDDSLATQFISIQELSFSPGMNDASRRTVEATAKNTFMLPFLSAKPLIYLSADATTADSTFTDSSETTLSLPFTVSTHRFTISWTKKTTGTQSAATTTDASAYKSDVQTATAALGERPWYWQAIPFMDLASSTLSPSVFATASSLDTCSYTGTYALSWKRPLSNTIADIVLPSGTTLSFARDITAAATTADTYQLKTELTYNALNLFGTLGPYHTYTWYEQESLASSLSATLKIPHEEPSSLTALYTGYVETDFYLPLKGMVKTGVEGQFETVQNWSAKATAAYKRPGIVSPFISLAALFFTKIDSTKIKCTRTDSMNVTCSSATTSSTTDSTVTRKGGCSISHALEAQVSSYVTLNASIAASYSVTDSIQSVSCTASLGGKVTF